MAGRFVPPQRPPGPGGDFMDTDAVWLGEPQLGLPFFMDIPEADRQHPALIGVQKRYGADTTVIARGNQLATLYLMRSGLARVSESTPQGDGILSTAILATSLSPGDAAEAQTGLLLVDGSSPSISLQTVDSCLFLAIARAEFLEYLARWPRVGAWRQCRPSLNCWKTPTRISAPKPPTNWAG